MTPIVGGSPRRDNQATAGLIKPGRVLFEVEGVDETLARRSLELAAAKLPLKTRFVKREEV